MNKQLYDAAPNLLKALQRLMNCPAMNLDSNEKEDIEAYRQATIAVTKAIYKAKKYTLKIKPAIPLKERHRIEDLLKKSGYDVIGGGTNIDMSECDISFESPK